MRTLLIDTCGDGANFALAENSSVIATVALPARAASASLLSLIGTALKDAGWTMTELTAIGVVNGPGSFTGVRVGLSCAKGLCEALGIPIAAVSRLHVLAAAAALKDGYAVLSAGRGELFVLHISSGREFVQDIGAFGSLVKEERVVIAEEQLVIKLNNAGGELHSIDASSALPLVLDRLRVGGEDLADVDANYGRSEQEIYGKRSAQGDAV